MNSPQSPQSRPPNEPGWPAVDPAQPADDATLMLPDPNRPPADPNWPQADASRPPAEPNWPPAEPNWQGPPPGPGWSGTPAPQPGWGQPPAAGWQPMPGGPYPPQQGWGQPGWPQPGPPAGRPQPGPGFGLIPVLAAAVLFCLGFLAVSWERHGGDLKFTTIFAAAKHTDAPSDFQPLISWIYVIGFGMFLAVIGTYEATMWSLGRVRSRRSAYWTFGAWANLAWREDGKLRPVRITATILQFAFLCLHGWGLWAFYDGKPSNVGPGAWMILAGSACLVLAALLGPRVRSVGPMPPGGYRG